MIEEVAEVALTAELRTTPAVRDILRAFLDCGVHRGAKVDRERILCFDQQDVALRADRGDHIQVK